MLPLCFGLALLFSAGTLASDAAQREYEVKAAFLFNFAKYGDWPAESFADGQFRFCIAKQDDVVVLLRQRLHEQRIRELPIAVTALRNVELASCHLLFIAAAATPEQLQQWIEASRNQPLLIIGETKGFLELGGAVNLFIASGTVHFEVSLDNLRAHRLQLSSKLLRHADRVIGRSSTEPASGSWQ